MRCNTRNTPLAAPLKLWLTMVQLSIYRKHRKFSLETNFRGQATPTKIKPQKICTHEELATVITMGYSLTQENLSPWKINPRIIATTKISTFTIQHFVFNFHGLPYKQPTKCLSTKILCYTSYMYIHTYIHVDAIYLWCTVYVLLELAG